MLNYILSILLDLKNINDYAKHKNDFCCIIAGYQEDIEKCFFRINKGLERRFQWVHKIAHYNEKELAKIIKF